MKPYNEHDVYYNKVIGRIIKKARKSKYSSATACAKEFGVWGNLWCNWENGSIRPRIKNIKKIIEFFKLDASVFDKDTIIQKRYPVIADSIISNFNPDSAPSVNKMFDISVQGVKVSLSDKKDIVTVSFPSGAMLNVTEVTNKSFMVSFVDSNHETIMGCATK